MTTGLHHDELIEQASVATGLDDFGDLPLLEPLGVLVESMNREAQLVGPRLAQAASMIVTTLVKRLRLVNDRSRFPGIADEVIKAPLFIVGAPRTGSTHLHALLAQITDVRAPMFWEMTLPSPPPERATRLTDPRIAQIQAAVDQLPEDLLKRHPIAPLRPEQCNVMMDWSFYNFAWLASYEIPPTGTGCSTPTTLPPLKPIAEPCSICSGNTRGDGYSNTPSIC